jgi:hypothetical protein
VRKLIPAALNMLSLILCFSSHANITVQNTAQHAVGRAGRWDWSIYLAGSPSQISEIRCVTYHLHPTFPYPNRRVCYKNSDPQHAFVLSTNGWGTFKVDIDILFNDGAVLHGQHELSFNAPISPSTSLAGRPLLSEEQQEIADLKRRVAALEQRQASPAPAPDNRQDIANLATRIAELVQKLGASPAAPSSGSSNLPKYKITLGNTTVWNGVAQGPGAKDTDSGTLFVKGPQGEYGPRPWGTLDLGASPVPV